jgi:predicted CXXCH cytochrome family protein
MKKWILRLLIGLLFAFPFGMVTTYWVQAGESPDLDGNPDLDCQTCHPAFYASWETSHHGQAMADPEFEAAWQAEGKKPECLVCHTTGYDAMTNTWLADGITCEACHTPINANHPKEPMPSDRSAALCGTCHQETMFEWQVSRHRETELDCVDCHGQHSTSLKTDDANALCANCHRERASNFAHTAHSEEGLGCADCHLGPASGQTGEGHAVRDHSFHVQLATCNACHAYQMHDPTDVHMDTHTEPEIKEFDAMAAVESAGVTPDPSPVSPIYYALLSALIGMAFGLLVSPWIERFYRRSQMDATHIEVSDEK